MYNRDYKTCVANVTDYKTLQTYYMNSPGSVYGPPPPAGVPNMSVELVPQYNANYGFNALTHNVLQRNMGNGHFTVANAYNKPCDTFVDRACDGYVVGNATGYRCQQMNGQQQCMPVYNEAPNGANGVYPTYESCLASCVAPRPPVPGSLPLNYPM